LEIGQIENYFSVGAVETEVLIRINSSLLVFFITFASTTVKVGGVFSFII